MDQKVAAQQYFPQYRIDDRNAEIALREYDLSAKALEADQKSLTAAAGVALFFAGTVTTLIGVIAGSSNSFNRLKNILGQDTVGIEISFILAISVTSLFVVRYFALLQISATFAARKIIVLRRLLGIDYGKIETVMPSDRLDGANEPFAISMFPGWKSLPALPVIAVATLSGGMIGGFFYFARHLNNDHSFTIIANLNISSTQLAIAIGLSISTLLLTFYRLSLLDNFENFRLLIAIKLGNLLNCPIKKRIGHVIYRMKLSVFEANRIGINTPSFYEILVWMEDKNYYSHNGNSIIDLLKALYRWKKFNKLFGASTILQQLARSNFLTRFDAPFRRKILEWLMAPWLNKIFTKKENLDLYICPVRYSYGVIGVAAAIEYYFPDHRPENPLSRAQIFFLIERLSNISATFPQSRINKLVHDALANGILSNSDAKNLEIIYNEAGKRMLLNLGGKIPSFLH